MDKDAKNVVDKGALPDVEKRSWQLRNNWLTFGIIGLITGKGNKPTRRPKTSSTNKRL